MVLSSEVVMTPLPTAKKLRSTRHENRHSGLHELVAQSMTVRTTASVTVCHTMAHAPNPHTASVIPITDPAKSPAELLTATMRTSMRFMSRLVCTMAAALTMNAVNMTRLMGMMRRSFWNIEAMSGAAKNSTTYIPAAIAILNHSTVE